MYRQENGITDHYSLFLRKSLYYTCKLYRSAESWLRMFLSCFFFCPFFSGPPFFISFFLSFCSYSRFPPFEIHPNELSGREGDYSWSNDDKLFLRSYMENRTSEIHREKRDIGTFCNGTIVSVYIRYAMENRTVSCEISYMSLSTNNVSLIR